MLHWHIVDFQSFPFKSEAMPRLVEGAYSTTEIYTTDDVKAIVAYGVLVFCILFPNSP